MSRVATQHYSRWTSILGIAAMVWVDTLYYGPLGNLPHFGWDKGVLSHEQHSGSPSFVVIRSVNSGESRSDGVLSWLCLDPKTPKGSCRCACSESSCDFDKKLVLHLDTWTLRARRKIASAAWQSATCGSLWAYLGRIWCIHAQTLFSY